MTLASIPSPSTAVWDLGPVPIRAYALFIILGIIVACVVTEYRLRARGAPKYAVLDIAVWAVPFGIVGGRLYHVLTTPDRFFGPDGNPAEIIRVWEGGLGIWGAIGLGALGVWLACRQMGLPFRVVADAAAVGIPLAQAVGRIGNWFNNELYGSETSLPWGLQIHNMVDGRAEPLPDGGTLLPGLYHPTFLYELLWDVGVAILVWQVGKRLKLGGGRQFALYVMAYTVGRFWIELLRIDDTSRVPTPGAEDVVITLAGMRINAWVSILVFLAALAYFLRVRAEQEFLVPAEGGGYRVVTEQEYAEHQAAPPEEPEEPAEPREPEEPSPVGAASSEPEPSGEPDSTDALSGGAAHRALSGRSGTGAGAHAPDRPGGNPGAEPPDLAHDS